jgi:hypothetical protein
MLGVGADDISALRRATTSFASTGRGVTNTSIIHGAVTHRKYDVRLPALAGRGNTTPNAPLRVLSSYLTKRCKTNVLNLLHNLLA